MHLRSEDIVVLRAALALSLMEVPGVAKMSPKEAINRVQLSRAADEKLLISINVDLETNADLGEVKNRIKDFVRRFYWHILTKSWTTTLFWKSKMSKSRGKLLKQGENFCFRNCSVMSWV